MDGPVTPLETGACVDRIVGVLGAVARVDAMLRRANAGPPPYDVDIPAGWERAVKTDVVCGRTAPA